MIIMVTVVVVGMAMPPAAVQIREVCWHEFIDKLHAEGRSIQELEAIHLAFVRTIERRCMVHSTVAAGAVRLALDTVDSVCGTLSKLALTSPVHQDVRVLEKQFSDCQAQFLQQRRAFKLILKRQPELMLMLGWSG
jgi:hypothetical protein